MLEKWLNCNKNGSEKAVARITAELRFLSMVSKYDNGKYNELIAAAEDYLVETVKNSGSLSMNAVYEAEKILSPAAKAAKEYRIHCVAHAHIDMNWMWGYDETVATTVDTFKTMLDLMNEYPDFRFSQSQASVYRIIEENAPDMLEEIKKRVSEGRWEITASTWVETDKNMPNGESLTRHILYTKDYLANLFGIEKDSLEIDFEPDTFGHNKNVPEILSNGGVKYYYHCRGVAEHMPLYRWKSDSGADILVYREPYWYNAEITSECFDSYPELAHTTNSKELLKVYGVGDHGGGPTRRDLNRLIEYNSYPIYPTFFFSRFIDFFHAVDHLKNTAPLIDSERNFLCDGCYTTQTTIKAGNRNSEAALYEAEGAAAFTAKAFGAPYYSDIFGDAWKNVLFCQFHDIIPGSGVKQTREYASALYQKTLGAASTAKKRAFNFIADSCDTLSMPGITVSEAGESRSEGAGAGFGIPGRNRGKERVYHIYNSLPFERREPVKLEIWDYEGDAGSIRITDPSGNAVPYQFLSNGGYWGHNYFTILLDLAVPSCGYTTVLVKEEKHFDFDYNHVNDMRTQLVDTFSLENEFIRVEFDTLDGSITKYLNKETGENLVDPSRKAGVFRLCTEAHRKSVTGWGGGMSAWFTGRYKNIEILNKNMEIVPSCGSLRNAIKYTALFGDSKMDVEISLDAHSKNLVYTVNCDWREFGSDNGIPNLNFFLPLGYESDSFLYDVPFGVQRRKGMDMDNPGNSFAAAENDNGKSGLSIITKTKYGFRCFDNSLSLTLIRAANNPDTKPEIQDHSIVFAVSMTEGKPEYTKLIEGSLAFSHPCEAFGGKFHKGTSPVTESFLEIEGNAVLSSVKLSDDGSMLVRLYDCEGKADIVTLTTPYAVKSAYTTDTNEERKLETLDCDGGNVKVPLKPFGVTAVKVEI